MRAAKWTATCGKFGMALACSGFWILPERGSALTYTLHTIGPLHTRGYDISDGGVMCGFAWVDNGMPPVVFVGGGAMVELDRRQEYCGRAVKISGDGGWSTGWSLPCAYSLPADVWLWEHTDYTGTQLTGTAEYPDVIGVRGMGSGPVVVGFAKTGEDEFRGCLWSGGGAPVAYYGTLKADGTGESQALAVDAGNAVVGWADTDNSSYHHACLWEPAAAANQLDRWLKAFGQSAVQSEAQAITPISSRQVAGWFQVHNHGEMNFLYNGERSVRILGILDTKDVRDMNELGQVLISHQWDVGWDGSGMGLWMWDTGEVIHLNDTAVVPAIENGWRLAEVTGINGRGEISGFATPPNHATHQAILLVPDIEFQAPVHQLTATAWRSVNVHDGVGELALSLDAGQVNPDYSSVEPRSDGLSAIEIDFDAVVYSADDELEYDDDVIIRDVTTGSLMAGDESTERKVRITILDPKGEVGLTVRLDILNSTTGYPLPLPNGCYEIDLNGSIRRAWRALIPEDETCYVRVLEGDVTQNGMTNYVDLSAVKSMLDVDITEGDNAKYDVNQDGAVNIIDVSLVKNLAGTSVSCAQN